MRHHTELDLTASLPKLTAALNEAALAVEDSRHPVAVLELSGGDPAWPGLADVHAVGKWERALRRWERLDAVTVAVMTADCGSPAVEILLAADVRYASLGTRLTWQSAIHGVWPGMGLHRLASRLGLDAARRLLLADGEPLTAEQAQAAGLVDEIGAVPHERLGRIRDAALLRTLIEEAPRVPYETALGTHLAACDRVLRRVR
ncbi:enoyl-CoA-hydratase DpgB [Streptosporangium sp. NPDC051023]|uniref:enoyl-CoA-hydratase DpgB n=1 Tax=Streptosporangium sp. NPDC051023 TaxID=3155410 RepID=UPI00344C7AC4